jgi:DNA-directed RNA polymerase alpha subunit
MISPATSIRALQALAARRRGHTLQDIADHYGVSRQYAQQLSVLGQIIEDERASGDPWYELSPRSRNALIANDCKPNPAGVLRRFSYVHELHRVPNLGRKSIAEIQAWLKRHASYTLP